MDQATDHVAEGANVKTLFWGDIQLFLIAVQFLTRIPVRLSLDYSDQKISEAASYYPAVGLCLGAFGAVVYYLAIFFLPETVALILVLGLLALVTGCLHEDGLADMCDGIGGGVDKGAALRIMKDSRLGTYGVTGLLFVLGMKVSALAAFSIGYIPILLIVGHCFSRLSAVTVILTSSYARDEGKAKQVSYGLSVKGVWLLVLTGLALSVVVLTTFGFTLLMGMWAGTMLGHILTRSQFEKKLGGYTGDCLGATQQVSETGLYLGALMCI